MNPSQLDMPNAETEEFSKTGNVCAGIADGIEITCRIPMELFPVSRRTVSEATTAIALPCVHPVPVLV